MSTRTATHDHLSVCPNCQHSQPASRFCTECGFEIGQIVDTVPGLAEMSSLQAPEPPRFGISEIQAGRRLGRVVARGGSTVVHWVGAHGGAGEDTLATAIPGTVPAGHGWPTLSLDARFAAPAVPAFLVARTDAGGLYHALTALQDWASGAVEPVRLYGLVFIADAPGPVPRPLRELRRHVAGGMAGGEVHEIPFLDSLRFGEEMTPANTNAFNRLRISVARITSSSTN